MITAAAHTALFPGFPDFKNGSGNSQHQQDDQSNVQRIHIIYLLPQKNWLLSDCQKNGINTRRTSSAATQATAHCQMTTIRPHFPPSSRRIAATAATQGV